MTKKTPKKNIARLLRYFRMSDYVVNYHHIKSGKGVIKRFSAPYPFIADL